MKILLLGKDGQVGWELQRALTPLGEVIAMGRGAADFSKPESLRAIVQAHQPQLIVNAAAYTAVDKAETEIDLAQTVNGKSVEVLAEEAAKLNAWLVHYSTDYVFDGMKAGAYSETDEVNPLSVYGKTKLAGEKAIQVSQCKHLIFRTSWVYAARGGNFAKTMLRLAKEKEQLNVVADQVGAPTSAELIADVTALILQQVLYDSSNPSGVYHLVASGETSWHGYAQYVLSLAAQKGIPLKIKAELVQPISTEAYPLPARRPKNSRLNTNKLQQTFNIHLPDWSYHVTRLIDELSSQGNL